MGTTKDDISRWFDDGIKSKSTHMLVVCDTFDWYDYPVYVSQGEKSKDVYEKRNGENMQRVMEVYNLSLDKTDQLEEHRAFNF